MITDIKQLDMNKTYSYADYLLWRFEERVEIIKGKIMKMSPAPGTRHQRISNNLSSTLTWYFKKSPCNIFTAPFDVRLPISEDLDISKKYKNRAKKLPDGKIMTVVQPDIIVICDENKLDERGCIGAPELVVEILSPGNKHPEIKDKFEIYQQAGVQEYWIVDLQDEFILIYTLVKNKFIGSKPFTNGEVIKSTLLPDFALSVSEIFEK
ncbi:MAG: Uma2 family endonuclease [Saprospiraceae bacterium]|jgi:Uma2 family endonuclease|nr:Uma2 family endonuclease [Saprospiraceae bacterium]